MESRMVDSHDGALPQQNVASKRKFVIIGGGVVLLIVISAVIIISTSGVFSDKTLTKSIQTQNDERSEEDFQDGVVPLPTNPGTANVEELAFYNSLKGKNIEGEIEKIIEKAQRGKKEFEGAFTGSQQTQDFFINHGTAFGRCMSVVLGNREVTPDVQGDYAQIEAELHNLPIPIQNVINRTFNPEKVKTKKKKKSTNQNEPLQTNQTGTLEHNQGRTSQVNQTPNNSRIRQSNNSQSQGSGGSSMVEDINDKDTEELIEFNESHDNLTDECKAAHLNFKKAWKRTAPPGVSDGNLIKAHAAFEEAKKLCPHSFYKKTMKDFAVHSKEIYEKKYPKSDLLYELYVPSQINRVVFFDPSTKCDAEIKKKSTQDVYNEKFRLFSTLYEYLFCVVETTEDELQVPATELLRLLKLGVSSSELEPELNQNMTTEQVIGLFLKKHSFGIEMSRYSPLIKQLCHKDNLNDNESGNIFKWTALLNKYCSEKFQKIDLETIIVKCFNDSIAFFDKAVSNLCDKPDSKSLAAEAYNAFKASYARLENGSADKVPEQAKLIYALNDADGVLSYYCNPDMSNPIVSNERAALTKNIEESILAKDKEGIKSSISKLQDYINTKLKDKDPSFEKYCSDSIIKEYFRAKFRDQKLLELKTLIIDNLLGPNVSTLVEDFIKNELNYYFKETDHPIRNICYKRISTDVLVEMEKQLKEAIFGNADPKLQNFIKKVGSLKALDFDPIKLERLYEVETYYSGLHYFVELKEELTAEESTRLENIIKDAVKETYAVVQLKLPAHYFYGFNETDGYKVKGYTSSIVSSSSSLDATFQDLNDAMGAFYLFKSKTDDDELGYFDAMKTYYLYECSRYEESLKNHKESKIKKEFADNGKLTSISSTDVTPAVLSHFKLILADDVKDKEAFQKKAKSDMKWAYYTFNFYKTKLKVLSKKNEKSPEEIKEKKESFSEYYDYYRIYLKKLDCNYHMTAISKLSKNYLSDKEGEKIAKERWKIFDSETLKNADESEKLSVEIYYEYSKIACNSHNLDWNLEYLMKSGNSAEMLKRLQGILDTAPKCKSQEIIEVIQAFKDNTIREDDNSYKERYKQLHTFNHSILGLIVPSDDKCKMAIKEIEFRRANTSLLDLMCSIHRVKVQLSESIEGTIGEKVKDLQKSYMILCISFKKSDAETNKSILNYVPKEHFKLVQDYNDYLVLEEAFKTISTLDALKQLKKDYENSGEEGKVRRAKLITICGE